MSTASTATVRRAEATINALEAQGIGVDAVEFDAERDTFALLLESGGRVGTKGLGGGTVKDVDGQGLGGGTVKNATDDK